MHRSAINRVFAQEFRLAFRELRRRHWGNKHGGTIVYFLVNFRFGFFRRRGGAADGGETVTGGFREGAVRGWALWAVVAEVGKVLF